MVLVVQAVAAVHCAGKGREWSEGRPTSTVFAAACSRTTASLFPGGRRRNLIGFLNLPSAVVKGLHGTAS